MRLYKTETLVLRSVKYREADSLLTLLTKEKGKVKAIAKGVRKINSRLRGGVQLFTHNQMLLYHIEICTLLPRVSAWKLLHPYKKTWLLLPRLAIGVNYWILFFLGRKKSRIYLH